MNDAEKLVRPEMRSEVYSRLMQKMAPIPPHLSLVELEKLFDIDIRKYRVVISVRLRIHGKGLYHYSNMLLKLIRLIV